MICWLHWYFLWANPVTFYCYIGNKGHHVNYWFEADVFLGNCHLCGWMFSAGEKDDVSYLKVEWEFPLGRFFKFPWYDLFGVLVKHTDLGTSFGITNSVGLNHVPEICIFDSHVFGVMWKWGKHYPMKGDFDGGPWCLNNPHHCLEGISYFLLTSSTSLFCIQSQFLPQIHHLLVVSLQPTISILFQVTPIPHTLSHSGKQSAIAGSTKIFRAFLLFHILLSASNLSFNISPIALPVLLLQEFTCHFLQKLASAPPDTVPSSPVALWIYLI